jgi:predicted DNA-binding transcriptional regulator YafY
MKLHFTYIDNLGNETIRAVRDIRILNYALIIGFCELRQQERTFYIGGILRPFDLEKNEPIYDLLYFLGLTDDDGEFKEEYMFDLDED